ncbi:Fe-S oxidoreductase [Candidatus Scalindua japonica]|uniref:Fe-S oxidoreductase n=2 Tax=Candidatus Scalindua japonica TaxID=1284222 RepID=A0A286TWV3_9BACT|nr:Fe-S oxidoreductase [Candidatus Scalindua japonica]
MDLNLFKKIMDEVGNKVLTLDLSGWGEPFSHPDIFEMIEYAKNKGVREVIGNTNITSLNNAIIEKILTSKLDTLIFSIDAASESTYQKIRIGSDFHVIHNNIAQYFASKKQLKKKGPVTVAQIILMKTNVHEAKAFKKKWNNIFDVVRISPMASLGQLRNSYQNLSLENHGDQTTHCSYPWTSMFICWNGIVTFCMNDIDGDIPLGNLNEQSLYEVWISDNFKILRDNLRNKIYTRFCRNCQEWKMCKPLTYTKTLLMELLPFQYVSLAKRIHMRLSKGILS